MRSAVIVFLTIAVFALLAVDAAQGIGLKVSQLNASATAINIPGAGSSGPITISLNSSLNLVGDLDQGTGEGVIYWPARISCPLLSSLGVGALDVTTVGTVFTSPADGFVIAYDLGYINDPNLGQMYFSNNNKDNKTIHDVNLLMTGGPGTQITGNFFNISVPEYDRLERGRLRNDMDRAMTLLQAYDPSVPALSAGVLDTMKAMYDADPDSELIFYFPALNQYRTSQLSGTDGLMLVPEPLTLGLLALGGLTLLRRRHR